MKTQITVEYPTIENVVIKTLAEAKAMGYKSAIVRHEPVNRPYKIQVKQVKRLVKEEFMDDKEWENELEGMAKAQTGMSRTAHQSRLKKSWNE